MSVNERNVASGLVAGVLAWLADRAELMRLLFHGCPDALTMIS